MTKARPALASVALLTARGLLSLVLGACAFPQNARPPDTLNPSLFQLQHTAWTEREGAPSVSSPFFDTSKTTLVPFHSFLSSMKLSHASRISHTISLPGTTCTILCFE